MSLKRRQQVWDLSTASGMHPVTLRFPEPQEGEFLADYAAQSVPHVRFALLLGLALYACFGVLDAWLFPEVRSQLWVIRYGIVCPIILGLIAFAATTRFHERLQAAMSVLILAAGVGITAMILLSPDHKNHPYYAGVMLVIIFGYTFVKLRFTRACAVCWSVVIVYVACAAAIIRPPLPDLVSNIFFLVSCSLIGMFACYSMELYIRRDFLHARLLQAEHQRAEDLLLNILPDSIADRLKQGHSAIADDHAEASVLFADIVGFTAFSARIRPAELVVVLNEVFSLFDDLAEKHGVEKIKTVGDAYMAVAGLPEPQADHAHAVADLAVDMLDALEAYNRRTGYDLRLRIGINSGPVVAGVIGTKKFIYDLWGDTVNVASRMESSGVPGAIQVTEATRDRLASEFLFEDRGEIEVKGRGRMQAYVLLRHGKRNEALSVGR